MNFVPNDEQAMFAETLARLLQEEYDFEHRRRLISAAARPDGELWSHLIEVGAFGMFIGEKHGGFGGTLVDAGVVAEQLGRRLVADPVLASVMLPARLFAALDLQAPLESISEHGASHAVIDARRVWDGGATLSQTFKLVEGASADSGFLVLAADNALFRVPSGAAGLAVEPCRQIDGRLAATVRFDDTSVERLADDAAEAFESALQAKGVAEMWFALGSMREALESTVAYVKERRQFGRALAEFQVVQQNVAEMAVACEDAAAAAWLASLAFDAARTPEARARAANGGKLQMARTMKIVAARAVQLHGGMGVCEELPIAAHYRQMMAYIARDISVGAALDGFGDAVVRTGNFANSAVLGPRSAHGLGMDDDMVGFRHKVTGFLDQALTDVLRDGQARVTGVYPEPDVALAWQAKLAEQGWAAPAWPPQFGGPGWDAARRIVFETECALAGAPVVYPIGIRLVAPVVQAFGSEMQQREWLPRILDGTDYWCQGFSEPGAGSDLASLSTRARADGDHYVVNGSKIWTTHAHHANRIFALVRTADTARRQHGITALAIDLDAPGVDVRPIISIGGDHDINEVFFSDVRVPVESRIGEEGAGWPIAKYLLEFERGTGLFAARLRSSLKRVAAAAQSRDAMSDPRFVDRFAELVSQVDAFEMLEWRTLGGVEPGQSPGPVASVLKLRASRLKQDISQLGADMLGVDVLAVGDCGDEVAQILVADALNARAATIFGGTMEIQLGIIAKSLAGL